jgi:hypothetical protein
LAKLLLGSIKDPTVHRSVDELAASELRLLLRVPWLGLGTTCQPWQVPGALLVLLVLLVFAAVAEMDLTAGPAIAMPTVTLMMANMHSNKAKGK